MNVSTKVKHTILFSSASSIVALLALITIFLIMLFAGPPTDDYRACNQFVIIAALVSYVVMLYYAFRLTESINLWSLAQKTPKIPEM